MAFNLIFSIVLCSFIFIAIIFNLLRKKHISIKYALIWLFSAFIMLMTVLIPDLINKLSVFLGFATVASMLYSLMIIILLFITMSLTIIVTRQKEKIRLLIQEVSLLKEDINEKTK